MSFISEAEFEAAQAAAPAEAPRAEDAPAEMPAPRPAGAAPEPEPEPVAEAPEASEPEVAALEPPAELEAPEAPDRIVPKVVTLAPPTAAAPPRPRPAPRVEPEPTPPAEAVRPAEVPKPVAAPAPEPEVARVEEPPAAPPEAAPEPEAEPTPPATLALETSGRPMARRGNVAPPRDTDGRERDGGAEAGGARGRSQPAAGAAGDARHRARRRRPTPVSPRRPGHAEPTSLPVGPPLSNSEKDGLKLAVQRCWNVPAGVRDAQELKVTLAAELAADGAVINASIRMIEPRNAAGRALPAGLRGRAAGADPLLALRSAARQVRPVAQHRSRLQPRGNGVMVNRLRRNLLIGVPAALALRPFAAAAQAPLRIEITEGVIEPMPFAAPGFVPDSQAAADLAARITQVVVDDLTGTGLFREIPRSAHIGRIANFDAPVAFADWKAINAQALITGAVGTNGDRAQVRFRLWDVFAQQGLGEGLQFEGGRGQLAAAGAQGGGRGLFPADRRERLFRQQGRLHRRERAEGGAAQAARDHGLRRGERGDADRRQRAGADAAAVAEREPGALHQLRAGRAAR